MARIIGTAGPDRLFGTDFGDVVDGLGGGDAIEAGGGDDFVVVHAGDTVRGGDGDDRFAVLEEAVGTGVLYGDAGSDVFAFPYGTGQDGRFGTHFTFTIRDFEPGEGGDRLDLQAYGQLYYRYGMIESGGDVLILAQEVDRDESDLNPIFRFEGVALSDLVAANITGERPVDLSGIILGFDAADTLLGTDGPDVMAAQGGADVLFGFGGDDVISAGSGDDTILGGSGGDEIRAGAGSDLAYGGPGDDHITGEDGKFDGGGEDTLVGGPGNDDLAGFNDRKLLVGGSGNDLLSAAMAFGRIDGGDGDDTVWGVGATVWDDPSVENGWRIRTGAGRDVLVIDGGSEGTSPDTVADFVAGPGGDRIDVSGFGPGNPFRTGALSLVAAGGDTLLERGAGGTIVRFTDIRVGEFTAAEFFGFAPVSPPVGTRFDDSLSGLGGPDLLSGYGGNDTLSGAGGDDTLFGGPGDDLLRGGPGDDRLAGGDGADTLSGGNGQDYLVGNLGADLIEGGGGTDFLLGSVGDDTLDGGAGDDFVHGGPGDDRLAGGAGGDTLRGGNGDDGLDGGIGRDLLLGHDGADTLAGGAGSDTLVGGGGADLFVMRAIEPGQDLVLDFRPGEDRLDLTAAGLAGEAEILAATRFTEAGALIVTESGTLLLAGMRQADLVSDFAV